MAVEHKVRHIDKQPRKRLQRGRRGGGKSKRGRVGGGEETRDKSQKDSYMFFPGHLRLFNLDSCHGLWL